MQAGGAAPSLTLVLATGGDNREIWARPYRAGEPTAPYLDRMRDLSNFRPSLLAGNYAQRVAFGQ